MNEYEVLIDQLGEDLKNAALRHATLTAKHATMSRRAEHAEARVAELEAELREREAPADVPADEPTAGGAPLQEAAPEKPKDAPAVQANIVDGASQ